jgi:asparagine synthase (glutamine-hydrolysing)
MGMDPIARYLAWSVDGIDGKDLRALCGVVEGAPDKSWVDATQRSERLGEHAYGIFPDSGPVDRMLGADFATILPHDLLVKMDIATMAHGLEARSPLLDHELVEAASLYPERVKLGGFQTKPLLRRLSRRYVPTAIRKAPKRGFEVPLVRWLGGELRDMCEDIVLSRDGLLAELFDRSALERLVRGRDGLDPARWSRRVWHLLMLGMWDRYVNKASDRAGSHTPGIREEGIPEPSPVQTQGHPGGTS